ncbi:MAG: hypothetical protein SGJ03_10155 [Alphaproteobacteria bacterium]|nr:hypothetical protein [Alphaproteobacteria bacterium]
MREILSSLKARGAVIVGNGAMLKVLLASLALAVLVLAVIAFVV